MKITVGTVIGVILALIMFTVLLSVSTDIIPTAATSVHNLTDEFSCSSTDNMTSCTADSHNIYGDDAASFGEDMDNYMGWFFVLGPFILAIVVVLAVFMGKIGRRKFKRRFRHR